MTNSTPEYQVVSLAYLQVRAEKVPPEGSTDHRNDIKKTIKMRNNVPTFTTVPQKRYWTEIDREAHLSIIIFSHQSKHYIKAKHAKGLVATPYK